MSIENQFLTKSRFTKLIESTVSELGIPYMEAVLEVCEKNDIKYFIDFGTGTTVDDIYAVNGVTHRFTPGDFTTTLKLIPLMKFGQYQSLIGNLSGSLKK